ncbi:MAG: tRNA-guanine(15) transglycosylase [Promethearchaeota archaeon]|nr:MAG: tRNA-guanine(15) transglycosylase [Candidatus Lokiarchaeota archaeon]
MEIEQILAIRKLKAISDYQFGPEITDILFENLDHIRIVRSKNTGKIRYVYSGEELLLTLKPTNGLFTLTFLASDIIISNTKSPRLRAVVLTEISKFIRKGRNVFCKHILDIDDSLRPNDEIIVVNQEQEILAIGRVSIPVPYIREFTRGVGVDVRKGIS